MNRKILALVLLLSLVFVLICPVVFAKEKGKKDLSFAKVHVPGEVLPAFEETYIDESGALIYVRSSDCLIVDDNWVINIGGKVVDHDGDDVWEFQGGTNYVLGEDFTYSGWHETRRTFEWVAFPGGGYWRMVYNRFIIIGTYDFALLGIDGTIEFYQCGEDYYSLSGELLSSTFWVEGQGTGELEGVTLEAGRSHDIYTEETGVQYATSEGTIYDWPKTYLKQ
jgi:hypothetical protein